MPSAAARSSSPPFYDINLHLWASQMCTDADLAGLSIAWFATPGVDCIAPSVLDVDEIMRRGRVELRQFTAAVHGAGLEFPERATMANMVTTLRRHGGAEIEFVCRQRHQVVGFVKGPAESVEKLIRWAAKLDFIDSAGLIWIGGQPAVGA